VPSPDISLILPCWKDHQLIINHLKLRELAPDVLGEIIVCAVETIEPPAGWRERLADAGARLVWAPEPSRGGQMRRAAEAASGDLLVLNHADTQLKPLHLSNLRDLYQQLTEPFGGAFYRKFDHRHNHLRWLEWVERRRNRYFGGVFGDQTMFLTRQLHRRVGGIPDAPLMEDVLLSRAMRKHGRFVMCDPPIATSARRFEQQGAWRSTLRNVLLLMLFRCGYPPERLHAMYYRKTPGAPKAP
jgi:hypothetical protein